MNDKPLLPSHESFPPLWMAVTMKPENGGNDSWN